MLLFISKTGRHHSEESTVSIHLMLLFILPCCCPARPLSGCFNTSHVTLYPKALCPSSCSISSFNTSHVTLYHLWFVTRKSDITFQYISCYSLSIISQNNKGNFLGFNTSHVTLYLGERKAAPMIYLRFNTSHVTLYLGVCIQNRSYCSVSIHLMLLFILYGRRIYGFSTIVSIHLMLLFIFPETFLHRKFFCFNTSHVTLYPRAGHKEIHKR